ncbi:hypothetical protein STEG23_033910 [Scotinomys teguina]
MYGSRSSGWDDRKTKVSVASVRQPPTKYGESPNVDGLVTIMVLMGGSGTFVDLPEDLQHNWAFHAGCSSSAVSSKHLNSQLISAHIYFTN